MAGNKTKKKKKKRRKKVGATKKKCAKVIIANLVEVVEKPGGGTEEIPQRTNVEQYVNLDKDADPTKAHPEYGRVIQLKARLQWASGDPKKSLAGKKVHFWAFAMSANRAGLAAKDQEGFDSPGSGKLEKVVQTAADGWTTETVKFYLSTYGGDAFEIYVFDEDFQTLRLTGPYYVWRKLWYALIEMQRPNAVAGNFEIPADSLRIAINAYEKVKVRLTDSTEKKTGTYQENFETHDAAYGWADSNTVNNSLIPWKVVYSAIDLCVPLANRETKTYRQDVTSPTQILNAAGFVPYNFNGRNWLISITAREKSTGKVVTPKVTFTDPRRHFTTRLQVDFAGTHVTPSTGNPVRVVVNYYSAPGYNGWGGANLHLLLCRGAMEIAYGGTVATAMGGTCTHEPGHALGLVKGQAWETTDNAHKAHCGIQNCVMWFQGYAGRPSDFHTDTVTATPGDTAVPADPNCHTYLRGLDLTRAGMLTTGGGRYSWKFPR
jgi:hypothetical protein